MKGPSLRVSVAMPTYNGAAFLAEQLDSIARQTLPPDELVITDDASKDDTLAVVEAFRLRAPFPVRVYRNDPGLGCNDNFAAAISRCEGDVIALSDQDDVWHADHLLHLVQPMADDRGVGLVISNSAYVDESLASMGTNLWRASEFLRADVERIAKGPQFRQWLRHHVSAGHALAFRATLTDVILPFHPNWMYDRWLSLVCAACSKIVMVDERLTLHRHHSRQTVGHTHTSLARRTTQQTSIGESYFAGQAVALHALHARLNAFASRLTSADAPHEAAVRAALFEQRGRMRQGGLARRVAGALATLFTGRYHRYARGWLTFARDLRG